MCTKPLTAFDNPTGGRPIFGWEGVKQGLHKIELPCGKCSECTKDYYTMWATRGSRELMRWDSSIFITLTYNEEHINDNRSLSKKEIQDFIKRVKKHFRSNKENPIRQSYCGEYGTKTLRPHYHAILYNCDFTDKKPHRITDAGHPVFTSAILTRLWGKGNAEFGYATPQSIAYLYKYILKKKSRKEKLKPLTLEIDGITYDVEHEFIESSRNPGIGAHMRDSPSIKKGYLTVDGFKKKIPKYYLEHLKKTDPETYDKLANLKFDFMINKEPETSLRREQREAVQKKLTDTKKKL